jgi:arylformamidase
MITDYDEAYANATHIDGGAAYPETWAAAALAMRESLPASCAAEIDMAYGPQPRNRMDLFLPATAPKGLCVFIHGGYWMGFGKSDWSHLARGALLRGWAVAFPEYTLAPQATISVMTGEMARAITAAATLVEGPIRLAGHSAGGHLACRMLCNPSQLPEPIVQRVEHVLSISGVHDLRPLMLTAMNETLKLTELEARNESPALRRPVPGATVTCWVGAEERPEFIRQSALLANIWHGLGAHTDLHVAEGRHHFNIIADLTDPGSALTQCFAP